MNQDQELLLFHKNLWIEYANESITHNIFNNNEVIIFDLWFSYSEYRKKIINNLKLKFDDQNFEKIFKHGYSSFDGFNFKDCASKMDVLNRINFYKDDQILLNLINDNIIKDLWEKIYQNNMLKINFI